MYLKDFAEMRQISYQTVNSYIRRNSSIFDKHKKLKNGKVWLSKKAIEILSNQYPLEVEKQLKTDRELIEAQQTIIKLQAMLYESQSKLMILENKEEEYRQLENNYKESTSLLYKYKTKSEVLEDDAKYKEARIQQLGDKVENLKEELRNIRGEIVDKQKLLDYEKSKTWWDKLMGR